MSFCRACRSAYKPKPSRNVTISSLSRSLNDVVNVDHFFLDGKRAFHAMDATTCYAAGLISRYTSLGLLFTILKLSGSDRFELN